MTDEPRTKPNETADSIKDRLWRLHLSGERLEGRGAYLSNGDAYVAGIPYLFTDYGERAFCFANVGQAQALLDEFPIALRGFTAKAWGGSET